MLDDPSCPQGKGKRVVMPYMVAALVGIASLLAACKEGAEAGEETSAAVTQAEMEALLDGVDTGQSHLNLLGAVISPGDYTTSEAGRYAGSSADVFQAARGGKSAHARQGNNADGPYVFKIYTDAIHQDSANDAVRAWITVVLPAGAEAGSYNVAAGSDAQDNEAQASLVGDGYGWQFAREVEGKVYVAELGKNLTAAWYFVAQDRAGETVEISGGVRGLAFTPQQEAKYVLSANGDKADHFGRVTSQRQSNGRTTLLIGRGIYLELPADADTGTYSIRKGREADTDVTVKLPDYDFNTADGELVLTNEGTHFRGIFRLTASGADDVSLNGSFDFVDLVGSVGGNKT